MEYQITSRSADALVEVALEQGEEIVAEPMVSYSDDIRIDTGAGTSGAGGPLGTVENAVPSDESLTRNTTPSGPGRSRRPRSCPATWPWGGRRSTPSPARTSPPTRRWRRTPNSGAGEGLTTLRLRAEGPAFLPAFGGLETVGGTAGEPSTVDTGHLVVRDDGPEMDIHRAGGLKSTVCSEEGTVAEFDGCGRIRLRIRNFEDFVSYLAGRLPSGGGGNGHVGVGGDEEFEE
jgi:uncharacterized protein (AIM24 family)